MNYTILTDIEGKKYKVEILFTHYDYTFNKNYVVYLEDNDLLASIYFQKDGKYIIDNDLSSREYDMIDKVIERRMSNV